MYDVTSHHSFNPKFVQNVSLFNLVCLKDCLVVGFQGNMATKPVHFVRFLGEPILDLQQTFVFYQLPIIARV